MARLAITLGELRQILDQGEVAGDPEFVCRELRGLEDAGPEDLSFVKERRNVPQALRSQAGALLVPERLAESQAHQLILDRPFEALTRLLGRLAAEKRPLRPGVHPRAVVDEAAVLGADVEVGPGAVIEAGVRVGDRTAVHANVFVGPRCRIGSDCVLHPNVVLREDVSLGDRVIIRSGSVLGSEGYGFLPRPGRPFKIPQVGGVEIGDEVEIGALSTIDGATFGKTVIAEGSKLGDMVHVGHNGKVGPNVLLLPLVALAGSVEVGEESLIAARSSSADNRKLGKRVRVGGGSTIFDDLEDDAEVWGRPARPKLQEMRIQTALAKLPQLVRDVRRLKKSRSGAAGGGGPQEK